MGYQSPKLFMLRERGMIDLLVNAVWPGGRDHLVGTSNPAKEGSLGFTNHLSSCDPITARDLLSRVGLLATWALEVGAPICCRTWWGKKAELY